MTDLLPCPFCECANVYLGEDGAWVECDRCDARGPTADCVPDPVALWNDFPRAATTDGLVRDLHLAWDGDEWADDRCGCHYHPDDDNDTHGGGPHVHPCAAHRAATDGLEIRAAVVVDESRNWTTTGSSDDASDSDRMACTLNEHRTLFGFDPEGAAIAVERILRAFVPEPKPAPIQPVVDAEVVE